MARKVLLIMRNIDTQQVRAVRTTNPRAMAATVASRERTYVKILAVMKSERGFDPCAMLIDFPKRKKTAWYSTTPEFEKFILGVSDRKTALAIGPRRYTPIATRRKRKHMLSNARITDLPEIGSANLYGKMLGISAMTIIRWITVKNLQATKKSGNTGSWVILKDDLILWTYLNGYYELPKARTL